MPSSSERIQELLAEKLAQQEADREAISGIINRYTQVPPKEDAEYNISGLPESEEGVIAPILSAFAPLKAKQTKAPESTYGEPFYRVTGGFDGDAVTTERPLTRYKPGEYDYKLGEPPIITGLSALLKFGDRALFGTPEEKAEAQKQAKQVIKGIPQILPELTEGTIKSARNIEEGSITTKDEDTGQITRPTEYLYNMGSTLGGIGAGTARSIARTAGDGQDGQVLGIMGGQRMKSGPKKLEELRSFEEQAVAEGRKRGKDPRPFYAELWGDQVDKGETLRVYRSVIDDQPRIEIDTSNVKLKDYDGADQLERMLKADNEMDLKADLDQLLDFPELFEEYPHLRDIPISYDEAMDSNTVAAFQRFANDPESGEVLLGNKIQQALNRIKKLEQNKKDVADDTALLGASEATASAAILDQIIKKTIDEQIISPILHEVQHGVQHYEKLESGGNLEKFLDPKDSALLERYNEYESLIADIDKTIGDYTKNQFRSSDIKRRGGLNLSEMGDRELGNTVHKFKNITRDVEANTKRGLSDGTILFMDTLREKWPNLTVEDKAFLNASITRSSDVGGAKLNELLSKTVEVDSTPVGAFTGGAHMSDALNNYEFRDLQFGLDDWAKVYDDMSGFLIDIDDAVLKDRRKAAKKLNKIINIQNMAHELYSRIPGEAEARLVQSLFEGLQSDVKYSVTPNIPQRKPVPRQTEEDFMNSLFSETDTPDFATGPDAVDAANLMITPRGSLGVFSETPEQFEADRRFMYPESALDVQPSEFIYHRGSDSPASRGKTKRALSGPPKGLANGGPVADRVTELLDATFRK